MPLDFKLNGEPGTPAWCARENTKNLQRIADALEELVKEFSRHH